MDAHRSLASCKAGTRGVIVALAPQDARLRCKLQAMGLRENAEIALLQTYPVYVVSYGYAQAAFDASVARSIRLRLDG